MRFYIDSANVEKIERLAEYYPVSGVTTNPTLIVNEKRPYLEVLQEIRAIIGDEKELFVQALGETAEEIHKEGHHAVSKLGGNVVLKVPVSEEGIKAIKMLAADGIPTLATTIYTAFQALMAAEAGAKYVAPYVNRIDNLSGDGNNVVKEIVQLFTVYDLPCEVLAASFKNVRQVYDCALAGAESATIAPDIFEKLIDFPSTKADIAVFKQQWQNLYGETCQSLLTTE